VLTDTRRANALPTDRLLVLALLSCKAPIESPIESGLRVLTDIRRANALPTDRLLVLALLSCKAPIESPIESGLRVLTDTRRANALPADRLLVNKTHAADTRQSIAELMYPRSLPA
jgi:hypothetical protein